MTSWIQYLDLFSPSTADDSEALSRSEEPPILLQTDLLNKGLIYVMRIDPHKCADITKDKMWQWLCGQAAAEAGKEVYKPLAKTRKIVRNLPLQTRIKGNLIV